LRVPVSLLVDNSRFYLKDKIVSPANLWVK
jgi:hypothetical protein